MKGLHIPGLHGGMTAGTRLRGKERAREWLCVDAPHFFRDDDVLEGMRVLLGVGQAAEESSDHDELQEAEALLGQVREALHRRLAATGAFPAASAPRPTR